MKSKENKLASDALSWNDFERLHYELGLMVKDARELTCKESLKEINDYIKEKEEDIKKVSILKDKINYILEGKK